MFIWSIKLLKVGVKDAKAEKLLDVETNESFFLFFFHQTTAMKVETTVTDLGIEVINKSNDGSRNPEVKKYRRKNIIHLWEFLLELLANDNLCTIICWSRKEFKEFQLKRPEEVARRWGLLRRRRKGMNYEKLSRALRFYYGQGIIQKVSTVVMKCLLIDGYTYS